MNLVTLITGTVIAMALLEMLLHGMTRLKRDLFYIAMLWSWLAFTAKYYYGPDISIYNGLYEEVGSLGEFLMGDFNKDYEVGYVFFTTLCKSLGLSFWWMTAVISTLFFLGVFMVLRRLKDKRVLALALVLFLMKDLIYAQLRQCLAVSFFVYALIEAEGWRKSGYENRKNIVLAVIFGLVAMTMHKSGIFMILLTAVYYTAQRYMMRGNTWSVLLMILVLLMVVPTWDMIRAIIIFLNLGSHVMESIVFHLSYMRLMQTNLLIYGIVLVLLAQYAGKETRRGVIVATASVGMMVIVTMYQYYFLVDRLRSYFVLLVVFYIFSAMRQAAEERVPYVVLTRQVCEVMVILFLVGKTYSFDKAMREEQGDLLDACTVLNLRYESAEALKTRQLEKAERFWDSDQRTDSEYQIMGKKQSDE